MRSISEFFYWFFFRRRHSKKFRNQLNFLALQFGLKITEGKTLRNTFSSLGAEVSQLSKWDELRKVISCHSGEKSKPAIQDHTISRTNPSRECECLATFLIKILVQTPYICHAFQVKFFPLFCSLISSLSCLPRLFSIWTQQKVSSRYLSQPAYHLLGQLTAYEQPLNLEIYALQVICFIYIIKFAFFV